MVQQLYSRQQLEKFSINQLRKVCDAKGISRHRSKADCITNILAAQPQLVLRKAKKSDWIRLFRFYVFCRSLKLGIASFVARCLHCTRDEQAEAQQDDYLFHDEQPTNLPKAGDTHFIGGFLLHCAQVGGEYAVVWDVHDENDVVMGEARMDWNCFWSHSMSLATFATPQETVIDLHQSQQLALEEDPQPQEAIAFETVADGIATANINGVLVRIVSVSDGYKTNLTGNSLFADYDVAIKESLLAVARLQSPSKKPALEVFATAKPNVYAVYSHKTGLEPKRYEVDLNTQTCTCPHYEHRHEQEGFKDKHIDAVKAAIDRVTPLPMEAVPERELVAA